mgnify:CR=1 FL=1
MKVSLTNFGLIIAESAEATVKKGAFAGLGKLSIGSFLKKTGDEEDEEEKDGKKDNKKKKKGKKVAINENVPEDDGEELQVINAVLILLLKRIIDCRIE